MLHYADIKCITLCEKVITLCTSLLRYAKKLLRYAVIITLCGNDYVMRRNKRSTEWRDRRITQMNIWPAAQTSPGPLGGAWIGWECRKDVVGLWWKCGSSPIQMYVTVGRDRMYHLMTCGDAPNCTWTDLAFPTLAGVNCAKHWEESIWQ